MLVPRCSLPLLLALAVAGCGGGSDGKPLFGKPDDPAPTATGARATPPPGSEAPLAPAAATKNTTRVPGAGSPEVAAGVALAVFPTVEDQEGGRPQAVTLVRDSDWQAGLVAAQLMAPPLRAPLLVGSEKELPPPTAAALDRLRPPGAQALQGVQVIRIGQLSAAGNRRVHDLTAPNPFALAAAADALRAQIAGGRSKAVLIVPVDRPETAMAAAAWSAKSGDAVLFSARDALAPETAEALRAHDKPDIYVLGPPDQIANGVLRELERLGAVTRISGSDAAAVSIAFARYRAGDFGWGVVDPGHGLVFASAKRPLDAAAAAPLSASGKYGPLVVLEDGDELPDPVREYLLDIQPGYEDDPVRGVYNHGWLVGDERAISSKVQAQIDGLLEIQPVNPDAGG